ncbi:MAG: hypothetical protein ACSHXB_03360 [Sulfitobacter sp.]
MPARPSTPKRWKTFVVAGTAAGLGHAVPLHAATDLVGFDINPGPVWITQAAGEAGEGGEGGESGAVADAKPDVAYLTRLALVEGHLIAATALYARGMTDEAVGLAGHPEAEMMDEVRETLEARGADDFTDALEAVGEVMADGADQAQVAVKQSALHDAIAAAAEAGNVPVRAQFDTILTLARIAAQEYTDVIQGGQVEDLFGYHEAYGFVIAAQEMANNLAKSEDDTVAVAAAKIAAALEPAITQFGNISSPDLTIGDASVLHGAAAQVELAALRVK